MFRFNLIGKIIGLLCAFLVSQAIADGPTPKAFDASEYGNTVIWLDAASGVEKDREVVTGWQALVGDFTLLPEESIPNESSQGEASAPPVFSNADGRSSVLFDPTSKLVGKFPGRFDVDKTFVLVVSPESVQSAQWLGYILRVSKTSFCIHNQSSKLRLMTDHPLINGGGQEESDEPIVQAAKNLYSVGDQGAFFNPSIIVFSFSGNDTVIRLNGEEVFAAPFAFSGPIGSDNVTLGGNFQGSISEVIAYDEVLSPEKLKALEKALGAKHAISVP